MLVEFKNAGSIVTIDIRLTLTKLEVAIATASDLSSDEDTVTYLIDKVRKLKCELDVLSGIGDGTKYVLFAPKVITLATEVDEFINTVFSLSTN